jgi:predicted transcriptional regulator
MAHHKPSTNPLGGHIRVYWAVLDSPAWRVLSHADVRVYLAMRRRLGKTNNGDISAALSDLKHAGISSSSTLAAALRRLETLGFIDKTRQGGIANGGKICSLYRFTDESTFDIAKAGVKAGPATCEWKKYTSMAEARAAVRLPPSKNTSKVRPSKRSASTIEAEKTISDSTIEHVAISPVRPSKRKNEPSISPQPA